MLIGWEKENRYEFFRGSENALEKNAETDTIKDIFKTKEPIFYRFGQNGSWRMRLELASKQEDKKKAAAWKLVRWRGNKVPENCEDVAFFNKLQAGWEGSTQYYWYVQRDYAEIKFRFSAAVAEAGLKAWARMQEGPDAADGRARLSPQIVTGTVTAAGHTIRLDSGVSLEAALPDFTVREIKEMGDTLGLKFRTPALKADLIRFYVREMEKKDTVRRVLDTLTLGEYRAFLSLCEGKSTFKPSGMFHRCRTLQKYGLIWQNGGKIVCVREFMRGFYALLLEGFEEKYLEYEKVVTAIRGGCMLYGILTPEMLSQVLKKAYPQEWNDEFVQECCMRYERTDFGKHSLRNKDGVFFSRWDVRPEEVNKLVQYYKGQTLYLPVMEELEALAAEGYRLAPGAHEKLAKWLMENYAVTEEQIFEAYQNVYRALHRGMDVNSVADGFVYGYGNRAKEMKRRGRNALGEIDGMVRKIMLFGFTKQEVAGGRNV